ncbi:DUF4179 domain-containing protein ['Paenibacillus yunnanensis' Narsing Rao et al. 2020]|uniref:DUF4179 domain-containing protein n=1 Tax=Paenibacillus tengchongensis TaxID=2608684 RepID=UPI00124CA13E|nr:DUF4179 domain-containing protein [Paenibacillus tengchongensis]
MNKLEHILKRRLNKEEGVPYPDFNAMWERLGQEEHASAEARTAGSNPARPRSMRRMAAPGAGTMLNWRRMAAVASLGALLAAAPVYAAIQYYDWSPMLGLREGVQTALDQELGQQLEQSVNHDGNTLTLHTAVVDENRTVILFSLEVGERNPDVYLQFPDASLKSADGKTAEDSMNYVVWDEEAQRYSGLFESDWAPEHKTEQVTLTFPALTATSIQEVDLPFDISNPAKQSFDISQGGIGTIEVQPFDSGQEVMLSTAVTFTEPDAKETVAPEITVSLGGNPVQQLPKGKFGAPGDNGEYTMLQYFKTEDFAKGEPVFKLQYSKLEKRIETPFTFDLTLSKKQMEQSTIKAAVNKPLEAGSDVAAIENLVVTPTQIRVNVRTKDSNQPAYRQYLLKVGGRTLETSGYRGYNRNDPHLYGLAFERPKDLTINADTPITLVGRYRVTEHKGDKEALLLTNISETRQTLIHQTGGYPVMWTYYIQGNDLFVETYSDDGRFGGVNQTHIGLGKNKLLGMPVTVNFSGDGDNKVVEVYKEFKGTEASVYMFSYTTDDPEKETRVQLLP